MSRNTSFYYSFLVLPPVKRRAIIAIWDFCRAVDDAVDVPGPEVTPGSSPPSPEGRERLGHWRLELDRCYGVDESPRTWQGRALQPHIRRFELPRACFEDVIRGVAMDLEQRRYETFDELYQYCLRVASAVGLICVEVFGYQDSGAREYAVRLGVALQLTNIIRDVADDLSQGRIYLPLEDLRRFECDEAALKAGLVTDSVRALLRFQCDRAREFYEEAGRRLPPVDARSLVAARIMGRIYFEILGSIERADYDVFSASIRVPGPRRAWIALSTWGRAVLGG